MSAVTLISHTTLASAQSTITLSAIPQTYSDLYLLVSSRSDRGDAPIDAFFVKINNGGYSGRRIFINPTSSSSQTIPVPLMTGDTATSNTFGNVSIYIPKYTVAQTHWYSSDAIGENNATSAGLSLVGGISASSSAVTSIVLDVETGTNFKADTEVSLFGITAGSDGTTTVS